MDVSVNVKTTKSTYSLSSFSDDPSYGRGRNLDVSLQFHLLLGSKEVLFLQFDVDSALSLCNSHMFNLFRWRGGQSVTARFRFLGLFFFYLKLSLRVASHNHHPLFRVWSFCWSDLKMETRRRRWEDEGIKTGIIGFCLFFFIYFSSTCQWAQTLMEAPAKRLSSLMCCPFFPMMAPTACAGM